VGRDGLQVILLGAPNRGIELLGWPNELATNALTTDAARCSRRERFGGARRVGQNVAPALVRGIG